MTRYILLITILIFSLAGTSVYGQTTVTASTTAATNTSGGSNVFGVTNNNTSAIAITNFSVFHNTANNGRNYTVWYHPTALTGAPTINTNNGWTQLGTSALINTGTTSQITTVLSNQYLVIPPGVTYRIAIVCNSGLAFFSTTGNNTYSNGNVTIQTGGSTVSAGYAGAFPSPTLTPRYFSGSITFINATPDNVGAIALVSPATNGTIYCANDSVQVRIALRNDGANPQTNFPVTARYVGVAANTISTTYTGTLAPFTNDTITVGKINLNQGTYTIRAYTALSNDTVKVNDTTGSLSFTFRKPNTLPNVVSDTVCPGDTAILNIDPVVANTTYQWFSSQSGGSSIFNGTSVTFNNLTQDTIMWVAADSASCLSDRVAIIGKIASPPAPFLGDDTAFCESIPLILDAGYPGAKYMWSTGDTNQTIAITNVSGNYWVKVTKYCTRADTVNVTIRALPTATGISYVRMGNTYKFFPSSYQNAESFLWLFGDGASSTDTTPVHTYAISVNVPLIVKLVVINTCDQDTVQRTIPTGIDDIDGQLSISMYPNPATNKLFIQSDVDKVDELIITNMLGGIVYREAVGRHTETIDISRLPAGNYFVRLRTEKGVSGKTLQILR